VPDFGRFTGVVGAALALGAPEAAPEVVPEAALAAVPDAVLAAAGLAGDAAAALDVDPVAAPDAALAAAPEAVPAGFTVAVGPDEPVGLDEPAPPGELDEGEDDGVEPALAEPPPEAAVVEPAADDFASSIAIRTVPDSVPLVFFVDEDSASGFSGWVTCGP
jgi:hypothetical protein